MTHPRPGGSTELGGRQVARIGYGAMQLEHSDEQAAVAVLRRARELGVDHLDTAEFYGEATSNRLIRTALAPYDDDLVLVSKVGAVRRGAGLVTAQRPEELRAAVEANLDSLGAERIDVVNLRRTDVSPGLVAEGDQVVPLEDQLAELVALREEGKIGAIGLSSVSAEQVTAALPVGIACVQNRDNLLAPDRAVHQVCRDHAIAWVPFFPLGSAFPGQPKVTEDPTVRRTAQRLGATPAQVGLAWLLAGDERTLLIPGTSSLAHLEENVFTGEVRLDDEALADLGAAADPG